MKNVIRHCLFAMMASLALYSPSGLTQDIVEYEDELFTPAELDSILAPIALYPDSVLSHVLIASTYPLEVIQAARWSRDNPGLDGELAVSAVEDFDWDPSVKALTAFPELLARMDEDIEWTQQIGDAFLVQEGEVIAAIQGLRDRAYAQGHLRSDEHVRVVREERVIYIEPVRTRTVYIPYYDPYVVYGNWWWDGYPPYRWRHPRYHAGISFYWGSGFRIAPTFYFSSFHWSRQRVVVVHHHHYPRRHFRSGRDVARYREARHWRHDPHHRRGVAYHRQLDDSRFIARASRAERRAERHARPVVDQRRWAQAQRRDLNLRQRQTGEGQAQAIQRRSERAQARAETRQQSSRRTIQSQREPSARSALERRGLDRERSRAVTSRSENRAAVRSEARRATQPSERRARVERRSSRSDFNVDRSRVPAQATEGRSTRRAINRDRGAMIDSRPAARQEPSRQRIERSAPRRSSPAPARSQPARAPTQRPARIQRESRAPTQRPARVQRESRATPRSRSPESGRAQVRQRVESRRSGQDGRRREP